MSYNGGAAESPLARPLRKRRPHMRDMSRQRLEWECLARGVLLRVQWLAWDGQAFTEY